jgi:predicted phage terminase large subunit-like protein
MTSASTAPTTSTRLRSLSQKLPTLQEIRAEKARRGLIGFTSYTNPDYAPAPHHYRIAEKLEAVERGEIDRLMIFMPPRHGKSELASRKFPARYLGLHPRRQIIAASYNSELATDFGRDVRNLVASPEYGEVFPGVSLRVDSKAADRMNTNRGGVYIAAGVGTATTGRGAHLGIIDDPFKDRQDADSERQRDIVWNWYRSTFFTRLMPGGAIVLIQTRWHEDDLAGRLLAQDGSAEDGGEWHVLELPALDNGKALWPDWYDERALERIKNTIGPREWSALYMQRPQPDEGGYFQRDWLKSWEKRPQHLRVYGTSDYAVTDGGGDYTVHRVWGVDEKGDLYRLAGWRGQTTADVWIEEKINLIRDHKPLAWFGEAGVIQKAVEPMLVRRMRERNTFCRMEWLPSISDKPTRARGFQARAAMGKVWLEPAADVGEFLTFPAGKHDDDVDCASMIGRALDMAHPAVIPHQQTLNRPNDAYRRTQTEESWRTV